MMEIREHILKRPKEFIFLQRLKYESQIVSRRKKKCIKTKISTY